MVIRIMTNAEHTFQKVCYNTLETGIRFSDTLVFVVNFTQTDGRA